MRYFILKCEKCNIYTMKERCVKCNSRCLSQAPAKFSIEDKFASYRRKIKRKQLEKEGLL